MAIQKTGELQSPGPKASAQALKPEHAAVKPFAPERQRKSVAAKKAVSMAPAAKASPPKATSPAKKVKPAAKHGPKLRLVRDGFTMPEDDFALIAALKSRALKAERETKKSEVLRAGLHALTALGDKAFLAMLDRLVPVKTGRPKKGH